MINPNTVKSQHELTNEGGRKSDVLLSTIEELEKTKKQLDIAVKALATIKKMKSSGKKSIVAEFALDDINSINMAELLIEAGVPKVIEELNK